MRSMNSLDLFIETFVSRRDDFALQRTDGGYVRAGHAISPHEVHRHLRGVQTIGSYVIDEHGCCRYAAFDADSEDGLHVLYEVQDKLAAERIASYLEARRGGHLWVFLAPPTRASALRAWLLPFCPAGVEFYPKQNEGRGFGSLIRLPLGVHHLSGKRYPFVEWMQGYLVPVAQSVTASLAWLASLERVTLPTLATAPTAHEQSTPAPQEKSFSKNGASRIHLIPVHPLSAPGAYSKTPTRLSGALSRSTVAGKAVARSAGIMQTGVMCMLPSRYMLLARLVATAGIATCGNRVVACLISCATITGWMPVPCGNRYKQEV